MNRLIYPLIAVAFVAGGCDTRTDNTPDTTPPVNNSPSTTNPPSTTPPANSGDRPGSSNPNANGNNPGTPRPGTPNAPAGTVAMTDTQVLSILMMKDHAEAAIGKLAQQKATSASAKELADMLVEDHTEHADKVQEVADSAGVTLLSDDAAKREMDRIKSGATGPDPMVTLQGLSGAEFDRKFGELMAQGHQDLIAMLERARTGVTSDEVRDLIDETLPVLREHEAMAREVRGTPGAG